ncbi:MAG: M23 family metallopeptidase [Oscillospiraceae bacterium]|nr:M23 family metallopeptidase [Oscillospiraceae bacterium]
MKIMNTKKGKFGQFMRKNGGYFVLGLVVLATCTAVYAGTGKIKQNFTPQSSNLNGVESKWDTNIGSSAQQTDTRPQQNTSSLQQQEHTSSLREQNSSDLHAEPLESLPSQEILFISPLNAKVLNKYSGNKPVKSKTMGDWRLHTGVDYAAQEGTTVKASGDGTVSKVYTDEMWGTTIEIEHPNSVTTIYSSLADNVFVKKGQKVESGQAIAKVGNTARVELSEASHLHFAVKKDGKYVDPESIITRPVNK